MNKKGSVLSDIILLVAGFIAGYLFGEFVVNLVKGWLRI